MSQPILVFDSGIGGLSVLQEIQILLPEHNFIYLFDNARLPYGELEDQVLINGCVDIVTRLVKQVNASMVVIACNTASTLVLPKLRQKLTIPVVGVVPAIKPAALISKNKQIGLLATPGTIKRFYTKKLIDDFARDCQVELFGSSELVFIAESKWAGGKVDNEEIANVLSPIINSNIDVLVLGCTHFPMLKEELQHCLGDKVTLLDSGKAIAKRVSSLLDKNTAGNLSATNHLVSKGFVDGYYTSGKISQDLEHNLKVLGFRHLQHLPQILD